MLGSFNIIINTLAYTVNLLKPVSTGFPWIIVSLDEINFSVDHFI
jgi:hypothetical protein